MANTTMSFPVVNHGKDGANDFSDPTVSQWLRAAQPTRGTSGRGKLMLNSGRHLIVIAVGTIALLVTVAPGAHRDTSKPSAAVASPRVEDRIVTPSEPAPSGVATSARCLGPAVLGATVVAALLWEADHEEGDLADWYYPESGPSGNFGGGALTNDGATIEVSHDIARRGMHSAKLTTPVDPPPGGAGARLFRWAESRVQREATYEAWYYFPHSHALKAPQSSQFWNIQQFKSRNQDGSRNDPFWILEIVNDSARQMRLRLVWDGNMIAVEGPHEGESGFRAYHQTMATVPIGQWIRIRIWLRQNSAGRFDGAIKVWQDDMLLFDLTDIRTGYDNDTWNEWGVNNEWSVNNYSSGLEPAPAVIYVDDARIWSAGIVPETSDELACREG